MSFVGGDAAVEPRWCLDRPRGVTAQRGLPPGGGYVVWSDGRVIGPRFKYFEAAERECATGVVSTWEWVSQRMSQGGGRIVRSKVAVRGSKGVALLPQGGGIMS